MLPEKGRHLLSVEKNVYNLLQINVTTIFMYNFWNFYVSYLLLVGIKRMGINYDYINKNCIKCINYNIVVF